jgi:geranylgeranylglycerol-phosphate geranylgeranyltransferase
MKTNVSTKVRALAELVRMDLALGAGFFFIAGEILAFGGLPPLNSMFFGFLTLFFISGSANISNDFFDREVDRVNLPSRPLPSGRISVREMCILFLLFSAAGMVCSAFLGPLVLSIVFICWFVALLYNMKLKESGFFGNLVVAFCIAMTFILGGLAAGTVNGVILTFAALAFFFDLGLEIASDAMDVKGDAVRSSKSVANKKGRNYAIRVSGVMLSVFFLLTLVPYAMGWLGYGYLILIALADIWMVYCTINLMRSRTIEEGRKYIRWLYLTWGIFMIVFALTRIVVNLA